MTKKREELEQRVDRLLRQVTVPEKYKGKVLDTITQLSVSGHYKMVEDVFEEIVRKYDGETLDKVMEAISEVELNSLRYPSHYDLKAMAETFNHPEVAREFNKKNKEFSLLLFNLAKGGLVGKLSLPSLDDVLSVISLGKKYGYREDVVQLLDRTLKRSQDYDFFHGTIDILNDEHVVKAILTLDEPQAFLDLAEWPYGEKKKSITKRLAQAIWEYEPDVIDYVAETLREVIVEKPDNPNTDHKIPLALECLLASYYVSLVENPAVKDLAKRKGLEGFKRIKKFSPKVEWDPQKVTDYCRAIDPYGFRRGSPSLDEEFLRKNPFTKLTPIKTFPARTVGIIPQKGLEIISGTYFTSIDAAVPETIQTAAEIQKARVELNAQDNTSLNNRGFFTANVALYGVEDRKPFLLFGGREAFLKLYAPQIEAMYREIRFISESEVYTLPPAEKAWALNKGIRSGALERFDLEELVRVEDNGKMRNHFCIDTAHVHQLRKSQRKLAELIHGSGEDYLKAMEMLARKFHPETRVCLFYPNDVSLIAGANLVGQASFLCNFFCDSGFEANNCNFTYDFHLLGVRR